MEETLGKRIAACRKRTGLTQDKLAELLGVTAQAVSKWENDQSCPDITMLPKLSQVFGVTTDELLGIQKEAAVHMGEVVTEEQDDNEPEGIHLSDGNFELQFDTGKKGSLALAVWILLTGGLMLLYPLWQTEPVSLWDVLWPSGLLVFGLFGLYPRFSMFRLGCGLLGGYFLLTNFHLIQALPAKHMLLPLFLIFFGLSLLPEALRKSRRKRFSVIRKGKPIKTGEFTQDGETFLCTGSFGELEYLVQLPRLSRGSADMSFGEMTVDLSGCEEIGENCTLDLNCSFGELELLVPRHCRVLPKSSTAFAHVETKGSPAADARDTIYVNCDVSFGQILIRYI